MDQNPTCLKPPVHLPPRCEEFSTCEREGEREEREERGVDPSEVQIRAESIADEGLERLGWAGV